MADPTPATPPPVTPPNMITGHEAGIESAPFVIPAVDVFEGEGDSAARAARQAARADSFTKVNVSDFQNKSAQAMADHFLGVTDSLPQFAGAPKQQGNSFLLGDGAGTGKTGSILATSELMKEAQLKALEAQAQAAGEPIAGVRAQVPRTVVVVKNETDYNDYLKSAKKSLDVEAAGITTDAQGHVEAKGRDYFDPAKVGQRTNAPSGLSEGMRLTEASPDIVVVNYDRLPEFMAANKGNKLMGMVACDEAHTLTAPGKEAALEAMTEYAGPKVFATATEAGSINNILKFEQMMTGKPPEETARQLGIEQVQTVGANGQTETSYQTPNHQDFIDKLQKLELERVDSGAAIKSENVMRGRINPPEEVKVTKMANGEDFAESQQKILDHYGRNPSPAQMEARDGELRALSEYSRSERVAEDTISKIKEGRAVALYTNDEAVPSEALGHPIPSPAQTITQIVKDRAAVDPDLAQKMGQVQHISKDLSAPEQETMVKRFTNRSEVDLASPNHSSFTIVDPSKTEGINLNDGAFDKDNPGVRAVTDRGVEVLKNGFKHDESLASGVVQADARAFRVNSRTTSEGSLYFTEGSLADLETKERMAAEFQMLKASGSKIASAQAEAYGLTPEKVAQQVADFKAKMPAVEVPPEVQVQGELMPTQVSVPQPVVPQTPVPQTTVPPPEPVVTTPAAVAAAKVAEPTPETIGAGTEPHVQSTAPETHTAPVETTTAQHGATAEAPTQTATHTTTVEAPTTPPVKPVAGATAETTVQAPVETTVHTTTPPPPEVHAPTVPAGEVHAPVLPEGAPIIPPAAATEEVSALARTMGVVGEVGKVAGPVMMGAAVIGTAIDVKDKLEHGDTVGATKDAAGMAAGFAVFNAGGTVGATIGAFGGPLDEITVPAGYLIGGTAAALGADKAVRAGIDGAVELGKAAAKTQVGKDGIQLAKDVGHLGSDIGHEIADSKVGHAVADATSAVVNSAPVQATVHAVESATHATVEGVKTAGHYVAQKTDELVHSAPVQATVHAVQSATHATVEGVKTAGHFVAQKTDELVHSAPVQAVVHQVDNVVHSAPVQATIHKVQDVTRAVSHGVQQGGQYIADQAHALANSAPVKAVEHGLAQAGHATVHAAQTGIKNVVEGTGAVLEKGGHMVSSAASAVADTRVGRAVTQGVTAVSNKAAEATHNVTAAMDRTTIGHDVLQVGGSAAKMGGDALHAAQSGVWNAYQWVTGQGGKQAEQHQEITHQLQTTPGTADIGHSYRQNLTDAKDNHAMSVEVGIDPTHAKKQLDHAVGQAQTTAQHDLAQRKSTQASVSSFQHDQGVDHTHDQTQTVGH